MTRRPGAAPDVDSAARLLGVSRETAERLARHLDLLGRWQSRINLVGPATLADPWRRHVLDSAQLVRLIPPGTRTIVDLGSGAGFPGLVIAIITGLEVHLVESDRRKAAFLREAVRVTGASAMVHAARAEDLGPLAADVVTARACAPLDRLLGLARPWLEAGATGIFPKGREAGRELTEAARRWNMAVARHPSQSDPEGTILVINLLNSNGNGGA